VEGRRIPRAIRVSPGLDRRACTASARQPVAGGAVGEAFSLSNEYRPVPHPRVGADQATGWCGAPPAAPGVAGGWRPGDAYHRPRSMPRLRASGRLTGAVVLRF